VGGRVLVVRRRIGEAIQIGDGIEIAIIEISPTRVRIGVTAPRDLLVTRKEMTAVAAENRRAAHLATTAGGDGLREILRMLRRTAARTGKTFAEAADKQHGEEYSGYGE
jgi:carbon storage regulator